MVASEQHLYHTIVLPLNLATGSIHDYLFCYCPLVDILFEVLRIRSCRELLLNEYSKEFSVNYFLDDTSLVYKTFYPTETHF